MNQIERKTRTARAGSGFAHIEPGAILRLPRWGFAEAVVVFAGDGEHAPRYCAAPLPLHRGWKDLAIEVEPGETLWIGPYPGSDRGRLPFVVQPRPGCDTGMAAPYPLAFV